jgi:hypothetical protein
VDFKFFIRHMREVLTRGPDTTALGRIRSTLDDPVFMAAWKDYIGTTNDYAERDECAAGMQELMRFCGDNGIDRNNELTNVRYGIGIGGSMVASSIIGLATAATGVFFVLPLIGGAIIAGTCMFHTGRISREERLYKNIETRISRILENWMDSEALLHALRSPAVDLGVGFFISIVSLGITAYALLYLRCINTYAQKTNDKFDEAMESWIGDARKEYKEKLKRPLVGPTKP